jgi:hypothetical protein
VIHVNGILPVYLLFRDGITYKKWN